MLREVDLAHDGELLEVLRLGIDVGAHVEQDGGAAARGGEDGGQRRAIDSRQRAEHHLGGGHRGAGVAGGDESGGRAVAHQAQPTRMDEFFLVRTACAAFSSMPMTSSAGTISMLRGMRRGWFAHLGADRLFAADQQHVYS